MNIPTYFDSRPVIIEILQILNKYPLSYWHFKSIIEDLIQEVDVSTPLVVDEDILRMVVDKNNSQESLAEAIITKFPDMLREHYFNR